MQTNDMMQCPISNLFSSSSLTHSVFIFPWNMYEIYFLKDDGLKVNGSTTFMVSFIKLHFSIKDKILIKRFYVLV